MSAVIKLESCLNRTTEVATTDTVDGQSLGAFLRRVFPSSKAEFLSQHGDWWHTGNGNRWVLLVDGQIAGYCAVIPAHILVEDNKTPALWWVDLVLAPEFRGLGLQSLFDRKIQEASNLKLGFPNQLAAKIHRGHGWGVREDFTTMLLPLQPSGVKSVQRQVGVRGLALRSSAVFLTPWASRLRSNYGKYIPQSARKLENPHPDTLAGIFIRQKNTLPPTTYRDAGYIQWRFLDAPYRAELDFYLAGPSSRPTHYLVSRYVEYENVPAVRVLDLIGDLNDLEPIKDLLSLSIKDAVSRGAKQVTLLATLPEIRSLARRMGFYFTSKTRFCWTSSDSELNQALYGRVHWALADSDNDSHE